MVQSIQEEISHGRVPLENMTMGGIGKIPKDIGREFPNVKNLRLEMKDNKVVHRFSDKFPFRFESLEHLSINGGDIDSIPGEEESYANLHCNVMDLDAYPMIKNMEITNVDFRDRLIREHVRLGGMMYRQSNYISAREKSYPALESLVITECKFDTVANPGEVVRYQQQLERPNAFRAFMHSLRPDLQDHASSGERYKDCPLHITLRTAPNLRELKIISHRSMLEDRSNRAQTQPKSDERVQLPKVVRLTIPPVSVWPIDIRTPNVQSLTFDIQSMDMRVAGDLRLIDPYDRFLPMIPTLEESPVDIDNLSKITHLGLECAESDTVDRLEAWLSRLPNLTSLSVHGNKVSGAALPRTAASSTYSSDPVSVRLLEALIDLSESIRKLDTLEIKECDLSDEHIVKFVKIRKESPDTTPLAKLRLIGRFRLSSATHARLHEAVVSPDGQSGFTHDLGWNLERRTPACELCEQR